MGYPGAEQNPPTRILDSTEADCSPQFSPDGSRFAFYSYRSGFPEIWVTDLIPTPAEPAKRKRGRSKTYPDKFFLKALVIMIVRQVHTPSGLLAILGQPSAEMQALRQQLTLPNGKFACRRTWERRLSDIPNMLPAQIACLGHFLLERLGLWVQAACAAAIGSTVLAARGGVWHKKDREANQVPHISIDTEAHWTKSGWHGWVYGWKLHIIVSAACNVWLPFTAYLTPASTARRPPLKLVGVSFLALAGYVALEAVKSLILREPPAASYIGIVIAALSLFGCHAVTCTCEKTRRVTSEQPRHDR